MNTDTELIDDDAQQQPAVFGNDMGLFLSNLYNFYEVAGFDVKRAFL